MTHIGKRIKQLREHQGLSISELATRSGVSRGYIHLIEDGTNNPTVDKVQMLATALDTKYELINSPISDLPDNIHSVLRQFAEQYEVPYADVVMLNGINIKNRQPSSVIAWKLIYDAIKSVTS